MHRCPACGQMTDKPLYTSDIAANNAAAQPIITHLYPNPGAAVGASTVIHSVTINPTTVGQR